MQTKSIKFLEKSQIKLGFTKKLMTAYGGFVLLAKFFEKLDFKRVIEGMIPFIEKSPNSTGVFAKILRFGLTVIAGGERFSHITYLGDSSRVYEELFGLDKISMSVSSITRFFNKFKSWHMVETFADVLWKYTFDIIIPWASIIADYITFDSTVIVRYGNQEGAKVGYNPKKRGRPSHHPLLAFLNRSRFIINLWNRSGDTSSGEGIVDFAKQTIDRLKDRIKVRGILADSGFYLIEFIEYLDGLGIEYVISARLFRILQKVIAAITDWKSVAEGIDVAEFEFEHIDKKWKHKRRYIVVRQKIKRNKKNPLGRTLRLFEDENELNEYRYGLYITSSKKNPEELWREYRLRASDENIIKETKEDFGFEGFCLKNFYGTEAAMLTRALFYNIIHLFRTTILKDQEGKQTLHTLRLKYLLIPSALGMDGKTPVLRLGVTDRKKKTKLLWIINKIDSVYPNCIAFETGGAIMT